MPRFSSDAVRRRANDCCEYCRLHQSFTRLPHEIDHIRARKHRGPTTLENTCLACANCNAFKGSNVAGYDPQTGELVRLFNSRLDEWSAHFAWDGAVMVGLTAIGRTTIDILKINEAERVEHRQLLVATGRWIPT